MCLTIREVIACYTETLRHLVQSVTEKEVDMIGYSGAFSLINKEGFCTIHICAALDHSSDITFYFSPAHLKNRILSCRCAKACLHSALVKPDGHGTVAKGEAFPGSTILSL